MFGRVRDPVAPVASLLTRRRQSRTFCPAMLRKYLPLLICVLAAGFWTVTASAQQPPGPPTALGDGLLLLRNGQSIAGKIAREGDRYRVIQPDAELRLRAADVEFFCHNFEEGYQRKRAIIQPGDVYGHLQLAQWCQRNELLGARPTS